ncbi:hypothetical protein CEY12_06265 [Chryseobacterium sp. T16E-39]|uniref:hypothetical protein n=1 Tax=Chryseobacterium sp. T16E-39 TaxID=2015076 RepID=UPI000B5B0E95|nr:hypothetical protein [Chryseobacterium sp. T16E-39]ASK29733.1 hypothetical protein CEY12_06265 [Chryseobacterium sp. T16E-39]
MFEKILQQLKTKYKDFGLSETILKAKAKQIEKAVKTEEEITDAVAGVEDDLAIFQSFADQNRTLAKEIADLKKAKGEDPKPVDPADPKPVDPKPAPTGDPEPAWAKAIREQMEKQNQLISGFQAEKTAQTNAQKLQTELDELKVSKSIQALIPAGLTFENDEAIKAYAAEMKTKSDAIAQEFGNAALSGMAKPTLFGETAKEGDISNAMQAYKDSKKPKDNEQH